MIKALLSILNVVEGEEKPVLLLLGYGFFMGIFLAAYKIVATALFLTQMSEYIREAFFVSGFLGVISTWFYSILQNRVQYSKLIVFNIISILVFIAIARILFMYSDSTWLVFALFVMLGPITSLLILGFWGIFGRLFDLRQSKRIIGGIDSGQLVAIIITTFSIPFLIPYIASTINILLIGEVGLALSLVFYLMLTARFKLSSFHQKHKENRKESSFVNILKNRYIVYLALFLVLSMSAFVFVDYSFMNVTEQQYPNEKQLASFLGVFEGCIMILSLLIQTFVNERLLSMYGIKVSLFILPIILMVFTGLAIFSGHYFGFDVSSPNFIWFFLFIALSKLFVTTLREATENPVFKLFFMPLDSRVRFDIQTKIEGTINEFSRALSGGIILLLGFLPFFELIHYSWILVAIIIGWSFLIFKIYHLYRVNIRLKLERQKEEADKVEQRGKTLLISRLSDSIDRANPYLMIFALRALSKISPEKFSVKIDSIKNDHTIDHNERIIQVLEGDFSFIHSSKIQQLDAKRSRKHAAEKQSNKSAFDEEIEELKNSVDKAERKLAAELISATEPSDSIALLIDLLNDPDPEVIKAAMRSSSELKKMELLPFLLDNLHKKNYKDAASDALVNYGEMAFPYLETIFYNSEQNLEIKLEIINIFGKLNGEGAIEYLWNKIDYPDKNVVTQVLVSLSHCGFTAQPDQVAQVKYYIEEDISNIVWNLKAKQKLNEKNNIEFESIIQALEEENDHNYAHIYMLLSMIYDQKSIELVKENIETKTNEGISYAIELLDVFLTEDIKQKIIPILDDIPDIDRIRRMQMYFPHIEISLQEILRMLINREYTTVNRWTKVITLLYLGKKKIAKTYDMELISNFFNPDQLLRETCAWSMNCIGEDFYQENIIRHEVKERNHLQNLILGQKFEESSKLRPHMRFELVQFLKDQTLLGGLPNYIISRLVDHMEEVYYENKTLIEKAEWNNSCFYIVFGGRLEVKNVLGELVDHFVEGDFLSEQVNIDLLAEGAVLTVDLDTKLLKIDKSKFLDLITNEYDVTFRLLDSFEIQDDRVLG